MLLCCVFFFLRLVLLSVVFKRACRVARVAEDRPRLRERPVTDVINQAWTLFEVERPRERGGTLDDV